jgi:hypothetical protein
VHLVFKGVIIQLMVVAELEAKCRVGIILMFQAIEYYGDAIMPAMIASLRPFCFRLVIIRLSILNRKSN